MKSNTTLLIDQLLAKKIVFHSGKLLLVIACLILSFNSHPGHAEDTVVISSGEWAPFTSQNLPDFGIAPHLVTAAFKQVNIDVEYRWYPWTRAMREAEDGNVDFSAVWVINDDRAQRFNFSAPVVDSRTLFFYRTDKPFDWRSYETFPAGKIVGITRGYSYEQEFDSAANSQKFTVDITRTDEINFKKLLRGRIDLFAINELVGFAMLKQSFTSSDAAALKTHPNPVVVNQLHLIRSNKHPDGAALLDRFNQGMRLLKSSGEYDKILDKYK